MTTSVFSFCHESSQLITTIICSSALRTSSSAGCRRGSASACWCVRRPPRGSSSAKRDRVPRVTNQFGPLQAHLPTVATDPVALVDDGVTHMPMVFAIANDLHDHDGRGDEQRRRQRDEQDDVQLEVTRQMFVARHGIGRSLISRVVECTRGICIGGQRRADDDAQHERDDDGHRRQHDDC